MHLHKIKYLLLALPLLVVCGCAGLKQPSSTIDYYTLEYSPMQLSQRKSISAIITVARFSVAPEYNTSRIIFRDNAFKRNAYVYHQWRANPGDLVTYLLSRDMKQSGLFRAVFPDDNPFSSSYKIEGSVEEFFEWDTDRVWKAVLSISITLIKENEPDVSKSVLFQNVYHTEKACKKKTPQALAEALSTAMAELSKKITEDVYDQLKK